MRVPLLNKTTNQLPGFLRRYGLYGILVIVLSGVKFNDLWAEGSKDFVGYPGYRMFLDTRDSQQLKVFARAGEFINVGSSHVGIQGGYINVYRPDGSLAMTFDITSSPSGTAIINNNIQEMAGPTGGGTTMGDGYIPGIIEVQAGQEGIWTVIFDYPSYANTSFLNILNDAPWTRAANQPNSRRVVLAWDVTVTSGAAGNEPGAMMHEGRLYSNEHISLLNGNGFTTSPTFYVLTKDGYLYEVDIKEADPFRFPISSNSFGIVDGNGTPTYKSWPRPAPTPPNPPYIRDDDPNTWDPDKFYLYEPQAEDFGPLINNKIFFNLPDTTMPANAMVTDVFRLNTHNTWLYRPVQVLELTNFEFQGANPGGPPCAPGSISFGKGGWFIFETNLGGSVVLQLDIDGNGLFDDPVDTTIVGTIAPGIDSIFWGAVNGLGVQIPIQDSVAVNYTGQIRFGEIHIALTDVENNIGGVTFKWKNAPPNTVDSLFYYNHTEVGGPISVPLGGVLIPGVPQPTTEPYVYGPPFGTANAGNDAFLDQWFFTEFDIDSNTIIFDVVVDCVCENATPELSAVADPGSVCSGQDLVLSATNTIATNIGDLTYTWSGPDNFSFSETIGATDTSVATITQVTTANQGAYQVTASTASGCVDTLDFTVTVDPTPTAGAISGGGSVCAGDDVTLTSMNTVPGIAQVSFVWSGPNGFSETGTANGMDAITLTLTSVTAANAGTYTLTLTSDAGCTAEPVSANITVNPTPVIEAVSGGGNYCEIGSVTLTASNTEAGVSDMICVWTGPNAFSSTQNLNGTDPIVLTLTNVSNSFEGTYTVICENAGCFSDPLSFDVIIDNIPEINAISPNGSFCAGTSITLTAQNNVAGTGPITYTWTGPNPNNPLFPFTGSGPELGPFPATIPSLTADDAGTYCLVLETAGGCQSTQQCVDISIAAAPVITNLMGAGDACEGQDVTLSASNITPGLEPIIFIWTGPNGLVSQGVGTNAGPFTGTISGIGANDAGNYTLTLTSDVTGCLADTTVTINVFPGLNIIDVTPDSTYCESDDIVLTAVNTVDAGDLTYQWDGPMGVTYGPFTVGSFDPLTVSIPNIGVDQAGTYTLTVTSSIGCTTDPITVEVGVNPSVTIIDVDGGGEICEGLPLELTATGSGSAANVTFTWTDPNDVVISSGMSTAAGPFSATVANPVSGTYNLVVSTPEGCGDSVSVDVEVIPLPTAFILNNDTVLCELDTLALCGQNLTPGTDIFDYVWTTPSGEIIPGTGNGNEVFCDTIMPLATFGAGLYTLTIISDGCTSEPDSFFLDLNPNPVISQIAGGGTFCEGDTVLLQFWNTNPAVDSVFYTCILPGGIQMTNVAGGGDTITIMVTDTGFVCCSMESLDGCVSSLVCTQVQFEQAPDLEASANPAILCENETLNLTGTNNAAGTGDVTYTWLDPDGAVLFSGTAPWAGPFPASDTDPQSGDYCLIVDNGGNCVDTACVSVIVNPIPEVVGGTINGGGEFCEGDEVELSATISIADGSDITYTWTLNGNPVETGTAASGSTITLDLGEIGLDQDGEYCLELVSDQGCEADPVCTTVTVNPTPEILTVTGGGTYCEGVDVNLNGTGTPGLGTVTYTWTGPNGFNFTGTAPSAGPFPATIPSITAAGAGVYTLVLTIGDCESDPESVVVEVNPVPLITVNSGSGEFCENETSTLSFTIDPNGANSVDWNISGPGLDSSGTVTTVTTIVINVVVTNATAGTYTITANSDAGCEAEPQPITISIKNIETPVLTASPGILCPGDELQLSTDPQQGTNVTYEWFKDGVSLGTTTEPVFNIPDPMAGSYTVTVFVDGCTETSATVAVTVLGPPDAVDDEYNSNVVIPIDGNVLDNDSADGPVTVTIVSGPSSGTVDLTGNGGFTYTPTGAPASDEFVYEICLVDCPEECDQATVRITYVVECIIPNFITPNGDGVNDVVIIDCAPNFPNNRLRIFNRWGDEIHVFEPYDNVNTWDGTFGDDNKPVPAGTYFYIFEPDKERDEDIKSGYIKVVR